jgi:hypothetical protein
VKGAKTYTIVNNLAGIAEQLLRVPTVGEFAILRAAAQEAPVGSNREGTAEQTADTAADGDPPSRTAAERGTPRKYTFRPRVVRDALLWLKRNNHLYKSVNIIRTGDQGY